MSSKCEKNDQGNNPVVHWIKLITRVCQSETHKTASKQIFFLTVTDIFYLLKLSLAIESILLIVQTANTINDLSIKVQNC